MDFKDRRSLEGVFDVRAESQVREYLIRLHAFGKTTQPQVLLSSEPSLPEGDIISLLTLGVTSRDRANANTTTTGGEAAAAGPCARTGAATKSSASARATRRSNGA